MSSNLPAMATVTLLAVIALLGRRRLYLMIGGEEDPGGKNLSTAVNVSIIIFVLFLLLSEIVNSSFNSTTFEYIRLILGSLSAIGMIVALVGIVLEIYWTASKTRP